MLMFRCCFLGDYRYRRRENFLMNAAECRDAMETLLMEAYRRTGDKAEGKWNQHKGRYGQLGR